LYDETQEVAKAYQAACLTSFLYDSQDKLVYREPMIADRAEFLKR
jgi:hypothetical protein